MPKRKSAAPGKRSRRSRVELVKFILHAAAEEFQRLGYLGATTAAIAKRAGVSEAQLFRYFESKSVLFREAIFEPLEAQLLRFTTVHLTEKKALPRQTEAALYIKELQRFITEHMDMIVSLVALQTYYPEEAALGVGEIATLRKYFDRGASIMSSRAKHPKVDPKLMVRVSFAAVLACVIFRDWLFPRGLASQKKIANAINDFVLYGINANLDDSLAT